MTLLYPQWVIGMRGPIRLFIDDRLAGARIRAGGQLLHGNATIDRANTDTEVAADTLFINHFKTTAAVYHTGNSLMGCVFANDVTAAAGDTQIPVDACLFDMVKVEIPPVGHATDGLANQLTDARHAFFVEEIAQPVGLVFAVMDAIATRPRPRRVCPYPPGAETIATCCE